MANLNSSKPVVRITQLKGLTVCQTQRGAVAVPIQWDYVAWTPGAESFVSALKAQKFSSPVSGYSLMVSGVVSPMDMQKLSAHSVSITTKALPGPLQ